MAEKQSTFRFELSYRGLQKQPGTGGKSFPTWRLELLNADDNTETDIWSESWKQGDAWISSHQQLPFGDLISSLMNGYAGLLEYLGLDEEAIALPA